MNKKTSIIAGFIVLAVLANTTAAATSFHVPGTLILDTIYGTYNAIIEEGYYFLVFDNTGYLTDNFNRNDTYVIYFLEFSVEGLDEINGQTSVPKDDYRIITFNFELPEVYVTNAVFEMYASESLSCFIADYEGLAEYFEFIGKINVEQQRTALIVVSSVCGGVIVILVVNIIFIRNRIYSKLLMRFKAYRNRRAGKRFKNIG